MDLIASALHAPVLLPRRRLLERVRRSAGLLNEARSSAALFLLGASSLDASWFVSRDAALLELELLEEPSLRVELHDRRLGVELEVEGLCSGLVTSTLLTTLPFPAV